MQDLEGPVSLPEILVQVNDARINLGVIGKPLVSLSQNIERSTLGRDVPGGMGFQEIHIA